MELFRVAWTLRLPREGVMVRPRIDAAAELDLPGLLDVTPTFTPHSHRGRFLRRCAAVAAARDALPAPLLNLGMHRSAAQAQQQRANYMKDYRPVGDGGAAADNAAAAAELGGDPVVREAVADCLRANCVPMWLAVRPVDARVLLREGPKGGLCPFNAVWRDKARLWASPVDAVRALLWHYPAGAAEYAKDGSEVVVLMCDVVMPPTQPRSIRSCRPATWLMELQRDEIVAEAALLPPTEGQQARLRDVEARLRRATAGSDGAEGGADDGDAPALVPFGAAASLSAERATAVSWLDADGASVWPRTLLWLCVLSLSAAGGGQAGGGR